MGVEGGVMTDRPETAEVTWIRHGAELTRFATLLVGPHDAPDVVAAAFQRTMTAGAIDNVRAYLFRAVANAAHDQRRSDRRRQARDLHAVLPAALRAHESQADVRRAIAALSVQQCTVVYFTYWEDLDAAHIGRSSGSPPTPCAATSPERAPTGEGHSDAVLASFEIEKGVFYAIGWHKGAPGFQYPDASYVPTTHGVFVLFPSATGEPRPGELPQGHAVRDSHRQALAP